MIAANLLRGEVAVALGDQRLILCLTMGALARIEGLLGVAGFAAIGAALPHADATTLLDIVEALAGRPVSGRAAGPPAGYGERQARDAIAAAIRAALA